MTNFTFVIYFFTSLSVFPKLTTLPRTRFDNK